MPRGLRKKFFFSFLPRKEGKSIFYLWTEPTPEAYKDISILDGLSLQKYSPFASERVAITDLSAIVNLPALSIVFCHPSRSPLYLAQWEGPFSLLHKERRVRTEGQGKARLFISEARLIVSFRVTLHFHSRQLFQKGATTAKKSFYSISSLCFFLHFSCCSLSGCKLGAPPFSELAIVSLLLLESICITTIPFFFQTAGGSRAYSPSLASFLAPSFDAENILDAYRWPGADPVNVGVGQRQPEIKGKRNII